MDDGTDKVSWTTVSGIASGDFFYIAVGLPTSAAALGTGTQPTVTVDGNGTKITLTGAGLSTSTTYHIVAKHGNGKPRRFS